MQIEDTLNEIWELGFIKIENSKFVQFIPPKFTVHKDRINLILRFLHDLVNASSEPITSSFFFTSYDAWREHSEPSLTPAFVQATPELLQFYKGKGSAGEPGRFIQPYAMKDLFPTLCHPVLAMGRHKNDPTVIQIPDTDFIKSKGYIDLRKEITTVDIDWDKKINKIFWRGGLHGPQLHAYDQDAIKTGAVPRKQRQLAVEWSLEHPDILDAKPSYSTTKEEMLKYKYTLDLDGEVSAWSALYWKMLSNSVVFKVNSHWEQWYYQDLKEWVHYIPVKGDLSDLKEKFEWALDHDMECQEIAKNATKFAQELTYENVLKTVKLQPLKEREIMIP